MGALLTTWMGGKGKEMGGRLKRGHMYTYGRFMLIFGRKQQNSVKQLSFNYKINNLKNLHKPLSLIHQRADRRSKKRHSLTEAKTNTILQKVNHHETAESYIPDEGTI